MADVAECFIFDKQSILNSIFNPKNILRLLTSLSKSSKTRNFEKKTKCRKIFKIEKQKKTSTFVNIFELKNLNKKNYMLKNNLFSISLRKCQKESTTGSALQRIAVGISNFGIRFLEFRWGHTHSDNKYKVIGRQFKELMKSF